LPLASSPDELARLKLVKSGVALVDDKSVKLLKEGGKKQFELTINRNAKIYKISYTILNSQVSSSSIQIRY